jgi:glycosyltransferase involved in cell wall biosynthesis
VKVVLSPRALEPRLNIHLIVEAFPAVLRRWPDALLVIAGRAKPTYESEIINTIKRLGLIPHIRLAGNLPADALPDYFRASDLVVSVASSEGFPNTVLEVMACGIPVLAGDIPQMHELLNDGVNARICSISVSGIETGMGELLADPEAAGRMAAAGRLTATKVADIDRNGKVRAGKLRALAAAPRRRGLWSAVSYRLVLRLYQVTRLLGFHRRKVGRGGRNQ